MTDSFYLARKYLYYHRFTTLVLIGSITLILYLPAALQVVVNNAGKHFLARANNTPLIIGPQGSPLELVTASVYFDQPLQDVLPMEEFRRIKEQGFGLAVPLHARFKARESPIVGTTKDYFELRHLRVVQGRTWNMLGECVLGTRVAKQMDLQVGDRIPVSSSAAFLLDSPPLRLHVVGIIAATETPDDDAVFVELETTWIIEGLGHGHLPSAEHGSQQGKVYTDITEENASSFHFHGDRETFPISAVLVIPTDRRAQDLLQGQYLSSDESAQIVQPRKVIAALLERVVMVRSYLFAIIAIVSLVTLLMMTLVIVLSIRLRREELVTISKIGCSQFHIASILGCQIAILLAVSTGVAATLVLITDAYSLALVRWLIF